MPFDFSSFANSGGLSGIGRLAGGLFGDYSGFDEANKEYSKYGNKAAGFQNPFYNAGVEDIGKYQDWLTSMSDPTEFINNLMKDYTSSPYADYEQQQALRTANNMASASGLGGSTPLQLQAQENAKNISSQDMDKWLQDVLGINTEYGSGLNTMVGRGQQSANKLTDLYMALGKMLGAGKFGQSVMNNKQNADIFSGIGNIVTSLF